MWRKLKYKYRWYNIRWYYYPAVLKTVLAWRYFIFGAFFVAILAFVGFIKLKNGYMWPDWTGFGDFTDQNGTFYRGKTLYDWLELLIIPIAVGLAIWYLDRRDKENDRFIAKDSQRQALLDDYLETMASYILDSGLSESEKGSNIRNIARVKTISVLRELDGVRKGQVLSFLSGANLIRKPDPIIDLHGADFSYVQFNDTFEYGIYNETGIGLDLSNSQLSSCVFRKASLVGVNLSGSDLAHSDFSEGNLQNSELIKTNLYCTSFYKADFSESRLSDVWSKDAWFVKANFRKAELKNLVTPQSKYQFEGAIMPDGSSVEKWLLKRRNDEARNFKEE